MTSDRLTDEDYRRLLELRDGLRAFLAWSGHQAGQVGLTPSQHQLLLAVRGHPGSADPTISEIAGHLLLRHNSAVELIDRSVAAGFVEREADSVDGRVVRVRLTRSGQEKLKALSELHLDELARLAPRMTPIWVGLGTGSA